MSKSKILFQLSGSIACFKACQVISKLVQLGHDVEVVASESALAFVGEATIEGLTGKRVHSATFASGEYMNHIHLIRWADLVILCPATANTISKMASGVGDDLITTLFLAHDFKKPYLVAPAMNVAMIAHPATQAALAKLREWGLEILESGAGNLACGEVGEGRLMEPDAILARIAAKLENPVVQPSSTAEVRTLPSTFKRLRVLITSGGTREPIDGVRSITNTSTGRTGAAIADHFASRGHVVTLLRALDSMPSALLTRDVREVTFVTFEELRRRLRQEFSENTYDVVIHAAAVSDYSVGGLEIEGRSLEPNQDGKIDSRGDLVIRLKRNPKIIDELREMAHEPNLRVVAFKLTNSRDPELRDQAVRKLAEHSAPDFIVHNDLHDIEPGEDRHAATIFATRNGQVREAVRVTNKAALAEALEELVSQEAK